jgi:hypothetical protein
MTASSWTILLIFLACTPVFLKLWRNNRDTSLAHAAAWAMLAWVAWILTIWFEPIGTEPGICLYLALAFTGCAGIAVLGARRPGVKMWNAVVAGLLLVELLPVAEALARQRELQLDTPRLIILAGACSVGLLNYLPTRALTGVVAVALGCACQWLRLRAAAPGLAPWADALGRAAVAASPGVILLTRSSWPVRPTNDFDRIWLGFRDRFGLVWGQRLREQFNQAARHAGWLVTLRWAGLRIQPGSPPPDRDDWQSMLGALAALMKRFERMDAGSGPSAA